jgi:hypothetical protein
MQGLVEFNANVQPVKVLACSLVVLLFSAFHGAERRADARPEFRVSQCTRIVWI